jgi:hypothetical protein
VRRDAVSVVPGAGWTGISNILVQAATEAFVAQSRFNPQHSAAWEQQLYNQIPLWLQHFYDGDQELIARVQTDKNTIQARISLSDVLDALEPVFQKVAQHATRIITDVSKPVLLSGRAALVPGLQQCLSAINHQVSPEQLADLCLRAAANAGNESAGHSGTVPFLNVLSLDTLRHSHLKSPLSANLASVSQTPAVSTRSVTHVLSEGVAWPLPVEVCLQQDSGVVIRTLRPIDNSRSAGTQLLVIGRQDDAAHLLPHSEGITVNGEAVTTARSLLPGDRIRVGAINADMQCIYVHDGGADHG